METRWMVTYFVMLCCIACAFYVHARIAWVGRLPCMPLKTVYTSLRTGDLVLFRYNEASLAHDLVSPFTHVGMVVDFDGKKCIIESHNRGDAKALGVLDGGVHVYDLKDRVRTYEGCTFVLRMRHGLHVDPGAEKYMKSKIPEEYAAIPYYESYASHIGMYCLPKALCDTCFDKPVRRGMFCSEFVGLLLGDLGVLPPGRDVDCLTPTSFVNIRVGGVRVYTDPVKVSC